LYSPKIVLNKLYDTLLPMNHLEIISDKTFIKHRKKYVALDLLIKGLGSRRFFRWYFNVKWRPPVDFD